jgi:hypothetical protein
MNEGISSDVGVGSAEKVSRCVSRKLCNDVVNLLMRSNWWVLRERRAVAERVRRGSRKRYGGKFELGLAI